MNSTGEIKKEEIKGFAIHGVVTLGVVCLLAIINLVLTPKVLWFLIPLAGMSIGLAFHYFLGISNIKNID